MAIGCRNERREKGQKKKVPFLTKHKKISQKLFLKHRVGSANCIKSIHLNERITTIKNFFLHII